MPTALSSTGSLRPSTPPMRSHGFERKVRQTEDKQDRRSLVFLGPNDLGRAGAKAHIDLVLKMGYIAAHGARDR